ncbi:tRNA glutamyl-Q(34) synthetase GluQRS [Leucobacter sp. GX24907]
MAVDTVPGSAAQGAGRYAPSPSGDLHLGNLRTALVAWLFARSTGRRFLMRIEDLDRARDSGAAESQLADLADIGIDWDGDPVRQTNQQARYAEAIRCLAEQGLVYECTCSRKDILAAPTAPHAPPGAYPGTCRDRGDAERAAARASISPRLPALRLRAPQGSAAEYGFDDLIRGPVRGEIDDLVLQRGDGTVAYNLAAVIDDAESGVDQVVRGDDLVSSTPRQIMLQQLLGLPTPSYAHVPLVLGSSGARLAKRDGAVTLRELRDQGTDAAMLRGVLATSLGLAERGEQPEMATLLERFSPQSLPRTPWTWEGADSLRGEDPA